MHIILISTPLTRLLSYPYFMFVLRHLFRFSYDRFDFDVRGLIISTSEKYFRLVLRLGFLFLSIFLFSPILLFITFWFKLFLVLIAGMKMGKQ